MTIGPALSDYPQQRDWQQLVSLLGSHLDEEQRVIPLGHVDVGSNQSKIRFRASRACEYVVVHVQSAAAGEGGVSSYDAVNYDSSTRYDMRENRQREVTITRDGTNQFVVFLVPAFLEPDGTYTKFDGVDADDHMATLDLGV